MKFSCWNTFVNLGEGWSISRYFEWWECVISVEDFVCPPPSLFTSIILFHRISVLKKLIFFTSSLPEVRVHKAFRWIQMLSYMTFKSCDVWQPFYHNYSNLSDSVWDVFGLLPMLIWCWNHVPVSADKFYAHQVKSLCRINTQFIINVLFTAARHKIWIII